MRKFLHLFTWKEASHCIIVYNSLGFWFSELEDVASEVEAMV